LSPCLDFVFFTKARVPRRRGRHAARRYPRTLLTRLNLTRRPQPTRRLLVFQRPRANLPPLPPTCKNKCRCRSAFVVVVGRGKLTLPSSRTLDCRWRLCLEESRGHTRGRAPPRGRCAPCTAHPTGARLAGAKRGRILLYLFFCRRPPRFERHQVPLHRRTVRPDRAISHADQPAADFEKKVKTLFCSPRCR
jgi:hypothetical protein